MLPRLAYAPGLYSYGSLVAYSEELPCNVRDAIPKALATNLDLPRFHAAVGKALGLYRYHQEQASAHPPSTEVIEQVAAAHEAVHQAFQHVFHLYPLAKVLLRQQSAERTRYAIHANPVEARAIDLLQIQHDLVDLLCQLSEDFKPRAGRPRKDLRNDLAAELCEQARACAIKPMQWCQAEEIARAVLLEAGIEISAEPHEVLRIVRNILKERNVAESAGTPTDADGMNDGEV